ncbi:hypothetical protein K440DRAFT_548501 [Wilcoxina mikolae CBS 423.85]|nr:hypothetical protein K440DRAFT_548501 [Wilcoxina mikolae CBS 423.85]
MTSSSSSDYDSSSKGSVPNSVPSLEHNYSVESQFNTPTESLFDSDPRDSVNTYCTTVASFDEEEDEGYDCYDHLLEVPQQCEAVPATPQEFAELFPSTNRLMIKHDDSPLDGNMNIRVDCKAPATKRDPERRITLFHVRMYDLRDRDFSVRRYGRECGREVAHVKRKVIKSTHRPTLQRSVSKAFNSFRKHSSASDDEFKRVERTDSGYKSGFEDDEEDIEPTTPGRSKATNTCTLEFSNYAHVDLTRRGVKSSKKYDFEYWGKSYSWKRTVVGSDVSYHLVNNATNNVVAHIRPDPLTPEMAVIEEAKGGFVPPCSLHINDSEADPVNSNNADVADVIVTTGLIALIDDCIKRKYKSKRTIQLVLPTTGKTPLKMNMEYVGPKRFIDEMFHRRPILSRSSTSNTQQHRPTPPARVLTI